MDASLCLQSSSIYITMSILHFLLIVTMCLLYSIIFIISQVLRNNDFDPFSVTQHLETFEERRTLKMEKAKGERTTAKSQFTRSKNSLEKSLLQSDTPLTTIERRFEDLRSKWENVQDSHDAYCLYASKDKDNEGNPIDTNLDGWIKELMEIFEDMELKADKMIESRKRTEGNQNRVEGIEKNGKAVGKVSALKIDKAKLPPFDGNVRTYPQFKSDFINHIEPHCNRTELALVLRIHLGPEVKERVESCGSNYGEIWNRLDHLFGRRKAVDLILLDIKNIPYSKNDINTSIKLINTIELAHWNLTRIHAEDELYNTTVISMIEQRMSYQMKQKWADQIADETETTGKWKFEMLLKFLLSFRNRLEYFGDDNIRSVPSEVRGKTYHSDVSPPFSSESRERTYFPNSSPRYPEETGLANKCWVHPHLKHPVWVCREFFLRPVEERGKLANENKACHVCLKSICPGARDSKDCKSDFRCKMNGCSGESHHNRLLHGWKQAGTGTTSRADSGKQVSWKQELTGTTSHADSEKQVSSGNTILQIQQA